MAKTKEIITSRHHTDNVSHRSYVTGYVLSVILTLIPFALVVYEAMWGWALIIILMGFAFAQVLVQLNFFIHLGHEQKPRWNKIVFLFMLLVLVIVVAGSLWIMRNLDYNMMHGGGHTMPDEGF